jgi:hypothetical protein
MAAEFCTDDGSCVVRELPHASSDAVLQRVADVIGDAFEYDAWFKKDGEPRRLAGGAAEVRNVLASGTSTFLIATTVSYIQV